MPTRPSVPGETEGTAEAEYSDVPSSSIPPDGRGEGEADDQSAAEPDAASIARRAYERFQQRGSEHGHDQEDWFDAERELRESWRRDRP